MKIPLTYPYRTVILADGEFPRSVTALSFLRDAIRIVCCDGATESAIENGFEPDVIVGDLDSISSELKQKYRYCLHHDDDEDTNDLTKAVNFCIDKGWNEITILGATGKREDHSLGNISLLCDYAQHVKIQMITDYGIFSPISSSALFESFASQQVSIFCLTPDTLFTFKGLKYPLTRQTIARWWQGTLNESIGNEFHIEIDCGIVIVFRCF